jgi:hypothetical protein
MTKEISFTEFLIMHRDQIVSLPKDVVQRLIEADIKTLNEFLRWMRERFPDSYGSRFEIRSRRALWARYLNWKEYHERKTRQLQLDRWRPSTMASGYAANPLA